MVRRPLSLVPAQADVDRNRRHKLALLTRRGKENERLDVRDLYRPCGLVRLQKRSQLLALPVGQEERVVVNERSISGFPGPVDRIATDLPGAALDLDQVQAARTENQEIYLIDISVI